LEGPICKPVMKGGFRVEGGRPGHCCPTKNVTKGMHSAGFLWKVASYKKTKNNL
jgi:hypothetical protein